MAAFATLGLASCSSDAPDNPGNVAEQNMMRYISVNITSPTPNGTRATGDDGSDITTPDDPNSPDFNEGTEQENAVKSAYFVFYDDEKNPVGDIVPVGAIDFETNTDPSINSTRSAVVGVEILKGQKVPAYVLCYLNPITPAEMLNPINIIETLEREQYSKGDDTGEYFGMSNSVYFDETSGEIVNLTPVAEAFASKKAAQDAIDIATGKNTTATEEEKAAAEAQITDIYVDRYAAKIKFQWPTNTGGTALKNPEFTQVEGGGTNNTPVTLTFTPDAWALNGEGKSFYIIKTFREATALGAITGTNYKYTQLTTDNMLGANSTANWIWNQPSNHRSYWSCSPAYYSTQYPEVASDVADNDALELNYQIYKNLFKADGSVQTGKSVHSMQQTESYMMETTVGNNGLHNATNNYAAIPSIIVAGKYGVNFGGAALDAGTTFYLYGTDDAGNHAIYFDATAGTYTSAVADKAADSKSLLEVLGEKATTAVVRVKTGEGTSAVISELTPAQYAEAFVIQHPTSDVLTNADNTKVKVASRKVTVQLTGKYSLTGGGKLVYPVKDQWVEIDAANANEVNRLLIRSCRYADKYDKGAAYYNIPIHHYGWSRPNNPNAKAGATMDWAQTRVGDFGVVRNHIYNIQVTKVDGLATGIGNPNDPIIPPSETKEQAVAYRLHINNWALLPVQEVEL